MLKKEWKKLVANRVVPLLFLTNTRPLPLFICTDFINFYLFDYPYNLSCFPVRLRPFTYFPWLFWFSPLLYFLFLPRFIMFFFRGLAGEEGRNDGLYCLVVVAFHWKWKQNTISEPRDWERKRNCRQQTRNLAAWFITLDPYTIPPPTWPIDFASLTNRIILRHRLWLAGWVFGFLSFFTGYLTPLLLPLTPIMMNNI